MLSEKYHDKWESLSAVKSQFANRDWFMGTSGNISIRVATAPTMFLVSASGRDKTVSSPHDFVLVDEKGFLIEGTDGGVPSAETLLHVEVYKREAVMCSLHVHTVANNVISALYGDKGYVEFTDQELLKAFNLWEDDATLTVPIIPNYAHIPTLAEAFSPHVTSDAGIVLIRNHGVTAWGKTVLEAKKQIEALEFLCQYMLQMQSIRLVSH